MRRIKMFIRSDWSLIRVEVGSNSTSERPVAANDEFSQSESSIFKTFQNIPMKMARHFSEWKSIRSFARMGRATRATEVEIHLYISLKRKYALHKDLFKVSKVTLKHGLSNRCVIVILLTLNKSLSV